MAFEIVKPHSLRHFPGFSYNGYVMIFSIGFREVEKWGYAVVEADEEGKRFRLTFSNQEWKDGASYVLSFHGSNWKIHCRCAMPHGRYLADPERPGEFALSERGNYKKQ